MLSGIASYLFGGEEAAPVNTKAEDKPGLGMEKSKPVTEEAVQEAIPTLQLRATEDEDWLLVESSGIYTYKLLGTYATGIYI